MHNLQAASRTFVLMKSFAPVLLLLFTLILCNSCKQEEKYNPDLYFSKDEQASLIRQTVRYSAKLAPAASHETKFAPEYDEYYERAVRETDLRRCFPDPDQNKSFYFLMTRRARSIWPAREAVGGVVTLDDNNQVDDYKEIFRTWKMAEDSLNDRSFELFDLMAKGNDLTPYQSKYKGDRYIEFPDDRYYFNAEKRRWSDRVMDSLKIN